ncbi:bZIP transcription factor [Aspergillus alliaceus]|uniref:bZIP transcription factor n=1 Tax=Petromyces alliaceus TaxID=209559 RepID=UPI0012A6B470|nr:uncharacterized protein BDW43DRAFT_308210 [Aspergillus alliaceus]KAB8236534.1 hypothetical protein BDW43DRAFT_308210 [Aspergillus alliaceus]
METSMRMAHPSQMAAHTPSPTPFSSPYMSMFDNASAPLELAYGLDDFGVHREISMTAICNSNDNTTGPTTPPESSLQKDGHGLDPHLINAIIQNDFKNVKRRMQNREAQRRFRERKEQRQKSLQQKTESLQTEYRNLSDQYTKRTDEVCRLLKENELLRSEVQALRQRWRIMKSVLQQPNSTHSAAILVEEPLPPLVSSYSGQAGGLDDLWRRLEKVTDDRPHSPS